MVNRFGISRGISPRETFDQVAEIAQAVETNDFEALWFIDHQLGMKDVYAGMNVAAMATEKIHIGSAVTNLQTRHPTVTANATTELDDLSKDRAMLVSAPVGWPCIRLEKCLTNLARCVKASTNFANFFPEKKQNFTVQK